VQLPRGNRQAAKAAGDDSGWFCLQCYFPGVSRTGEDKYIAAQVCSRAAEPQGWGNSWHTTAFVATAAGHSHSAD